MKDKKPKMSRKERERQMIAEMESALAEQKFPEEGSFKGAEETPEEAPKQERKRAEKEKKSGEQKLHCPRCRSLMEDGKCPTCGHYIYVPMSKEKQKKIRMIVGGVCVVGFVILFVLLQLKK